MSFQKLEKKGVMVATTYASAGLGHLRVVRALESVLPPHIEPVLFRSSDESVVGIHRLMSIHPLLRRFMEWSQTGVQERVFSDLYLRFLKNGEERVFTHLSDAIIQKQAHTCVIVCTHFGLGHQISRLKERIAKKTGAKIIVCVVVTDDSPQMLWAVPDADLIACPSHHTASLLAQYLPYHARSRIKTIPYPLSQSLGEDLRDKQLLNRMDQLSGKAPEIHFSVPVSGAAVGLRNTEVLIRNLKKGNENMVFHVIAKDAPFTHQFIKKMKTKKRVFMGSAHHEYDVVAIYNDLYIDRVISFEITKPSEQAFKALLCPSHRGGAVLLFTDPVGRQEYDNLYFLSRHGLLPTETEQKRLWNRQIDGLEPAYWRGIRLLSDPVEASDFILWCMSAGIFSQMLACRSTPQSWDDHAEEMGWHGAEKFWAEVQKLL